MSRKSRRNEPTRNPPSPVPAKSRGGIGRGAIFAIAGAVLVLLFVSGVLAYRSTQEEAARQAAAKSAAHIASSHAPAMGKPDAKVHIVEFLDPACETCAVMYPHVKKLMADNPGRIRLSLRHVPFHHGSEHVVRLLESARAQDRYRETLEALFASQDRWVVNHRVYPERVWPLLEGIGLDLERVRREMNAADVAARMDKDMADAQALKVTKTPEYFVNGRPLPRFGLEELQALVREELRAAYP
ncbi:MAG: thioredoxin domain-containing protein [Burkholderiales bacterium]|nr:thioredoxin domain-containing protein [Burkholderiales bacterium]